MAEPMGGRNHDELASHLAPVRPERRYVMEHWGELGKDYKLDY